MCGATLFVLAHSTLSLLYVGDVDSLCSCGRSLILAAAKLGSNDWTGHRLQLICGLLQALGLATMAVPNLEVNSVLKNHRRFTAAMMLFWAMSHLSLVIVLPSLYSTGYSRAAYGAALLPFVYLALRFRPVVNLEGGYIRLTQLFVLVLAFDMVGQGVVWLLEPGLHGKGDWNTWTYFPNTNQIRNQYVANPALGYPMCLSACPSVRA